MLRFKKQHSLFTLIKENSNDAKKLYKLVSQLMGQKEDNPIPEEDDDTKLDEQFGEFFLNIISSTSGNYSTIYHHTKLKKIQLPNSINSHNK